MKSTKFGFVAAIAFTAVMFFTGCVDDCKDIACVKGECLEGLCVCTAGYEGVLCDAALNAKYTGLYTLTETCTSGGDSYAVTVAPKSTSQTEVTFSGLYRETAAITAVVAADGLSFTIARQPLLAGFEIEATVGTTVATGATINITYKVWNTTTGLLADTCTGTLAK